MLFEWNEGKRLANLRKHGIDFRDAHLAFAGLTVMREDSRYAYGERRLHTLGLFFTGQWWR